MFVRYTKLPDSITLHFICGLMAGFTATVVGSPMDVLQSRILNGTIHHKGLWNCIYYTYVEEGFLAFYNGFWANFYRIGSYNICMFIALEQIKKYFL